MSSFYSLPHRRYRSPSAIGGWVGSCRGASTRAQCHVVFRRLGIGLKWWGRPPGRCELIDFLKTGHKFRGCVMYPVAPRIACTACKREVFFAIRLRHARLQLIHIFPGLQPTPSSACLVWIELNSLATGGSRGTRADWSEPQK